MKQFKELKDFNMGEFSMGVLNMGVLNMGEFNIKKFNNYDSFDDVFFHLQINCCFWLTYFR